MDVAYSQLSNWTYLQSKLHS